MSLSIPFTQYMRPRGTRKQIGWEIDGDEEMEMKARKLLEAGCVFEAEVLNTGHVSMTVQKLKTHEEQMRLTAPDEDEYLAHELCENNPEVPLAVKRLVDKAFSRL